MNSGRLNVKAKPNSLNIEFEEQSVENIYNNNKPFLKCIRRKTHYGDYVAPVYEDGTKELSDNLRSFQENWEQYLANVRWSDIT